MPRPTTHTVTNLVAELAGGLELRRKKKVNPFQAATGGVAPVAELPPAPPVGLIYPR
ncbi:hypothetical protein [Deinococcus enclensis]|uniref:Uncharacterized protein n=1 Tax=Deinococcus enclensis TaxID=1049582 RepID=A0ABT9MB64_9DEIO|nr:hypothetical protein [Deinococcus enclensis]MDP9763832.1 hypothetical protein [Deinococcus enclensis]